ncbi:zinc finger MYM-type protein 1-like [Prunus persica]|uniref:zinc finger MYM-type protein 1-like n=1 Tax=Prunus persica TaxID=3760 RepID=UPI0009AB5BEA|nr:zinc finger MYM-type protein 1-like [Prunus persica]
MPQTLMRESNRRFLVKWFDSFVWLEYSKEKDAAFCFHCYLFKCDFDKQGKAGSDVFTEKGYSLRQGLPFRGHDESETSSNKGNYVELLQFLADHDEKVRAVVFENAPRNLKYSLRQGLPFRGHDESETSSNKGNYVELLQFLADDDEKVRAVVFENAPRNLKYIAPTIQKDLINSCAAETIDAIISDMDDAFFSILVDESRDVSIREQMAVVLRYVNKKGQVIVRLRGQGYDDASKGELNGLKTQILREYPQAYYARCFAHQLQLALVAVANGNENIATFFTTANSVVNIIGALCQRRDALREQQQQDIMETLEIDGLEMGRGFILGITNDLLKALQKKDQDIVNAMILVQRCKQKLQSMRDDDFDDLLREVSIFCGKNDIDAPNMDDLFVPQGRSRRKAQKITNRQYYRVDLFLTIIDKQLVELNNRFTEINTELLLCMTCLSPAYNFAAFDKQKILRFAKFYPQEFNDRDLMKLED